MAKRIVEPCGFHCIKMNHIGVKFGEQVVLDDINLHIHCGTLSAIIGKNGAGKSTLVRAILGDIPHSGEIEFKNLRNEKIRNLRIGYVPQKINIEKYTPLSVYDLFASFLGRTPVFLAKNKKYYARIQEVLRIFEAEGLVDKQVCNLSGGQLQRVLLSLAIINEPDLLILDEPAAGIDQNGIGLFYKNIDYLKRHFDLAVILISHDLEYVRRFADHVILLDKQIVRQGTAKDVFESEEFGQVFGFPGEPASSVLEKPYTGRKQKPEGFYDASYRGKGKS